MSELWYDSKNMQEMEDSGLAILIYNYGEDLQVLREDRDTLQERIDVINQDYQDMDASYALVVKALQSRINELEESQRWIPVSERLPEEGINVLSTDSKGRIYQSKLRHGAFRVMFHCDEHSGVTHWMPLPPTPIEGDKK